MIINKSVKVKRLHDLIREHDRTREAGAVIALESQIEQLRKEINEEVKGFVSKIDSVPTENIAYAMGEKMKNDLKKVLADGVIKFLTEKKVIKEDMRKVLSCAYHSLKNSKK